jgi:NTP pyrophosphatase (non-canonical NTP hydrolase)
MEHIKTISEFKVDDAVEQAFRQGMRCDDLRIEQIAEHYGYSAQSDIAIEECAELQKAILKLRRGWNTERYAELLGEIADVLIMSRQLRYIFGYDKIDRIVDEKLNRQIERINNEIH